MLDETLTIFVVARGVRDARGRMQGLGGRATRENQRAKYVNSPEGELYRKSRTLYGIEKARSAIAKAGRAVVVEALDFAPKATRASHGRPASSWVRDYSA